MRQFKLFEGEFKLHEILTSEYKTYKTRERKQTIEYLDVIASFDIETTSFSDGKEKRGTMYIWMLCVDGKTTTGRTWAEFLDTIDRICEHYNLSEDRRIIIWVHNLAFEFQWIQKLFSWKYVFARDERKPMKAVTLDGIEFRCSYILSGVSLAKVGEDLQKYKVKKLVGSLDYKLPRHSKTPLTEQEMAYCINDVLVVNAYIREQIEYYKRITWLPLTNTGRVRKLCKKECYNKQNYLRYKKLMERLTLEVDEYKLLKQAFMGGFTHANFMYTEDVCENVQSFDFTSSYPTVMIAEKYPATKGEYVIVEDIQDILDTKTQWCYIFNVRFKNIRAIEDENYISASKCFKKINYKENNGRIYRADEIETTITEIDFEIIEQFYEWDEVEVGRCVRYRKAYLPHPFVEIIVSLYEYKTTLKDVEGKELDYLLKKGMLNSTYGMACMDVAADEISYTDHWESDSVDLQEAIEQYNTSNSRFLFYPWAVYITAYARRNLFYAIKYCKQDYIYADTDSVKIKNKEKYMDFINRYNEWIVKKLDMACEYHKIDPERLRPKTIKGEVKQLGIWDDDGYYEKFKTLGAKRYLTQKKEKITATVAGVNKKKLSEYIKTQENPFDYFKDGMEVPAPHSGKITARYIDEETSGYIIDYLGQKEIYHEMSSVHMGVSEYKLGLSEAYRMLLNGRAEVYYG